MHNILFRADSLSTIGTAHIFFATQELQGNINNKIEEKNYKIEILNSNDLDVLVKDMLKVSKV